MKIFKQYNFWIKLVALLILVLNILGEVFGFSVDSALFMDVSSALMSILVVLGVIQVPATIANGKQENNIGDGGNNMNSITSVSELLSHYKRETQDLEILVGKENLDIIVGLMDGMIAHLPTGFKQEKAEEAEVDGAESAESLSQEDEKTEAVEETEEIVETENGEVASSVNIEKIEESAAEAENLIDAEKIIEAEKDVIIESKNLVLDSPCVVDNTCTYSAPKTVEEHMEDIKEKIKTLISSNLDAIISEALEEN